MGTRHDTSTCPLAAVHQRMEDAHRLWHQALESYFDPEAFRVALQGCIQTLRTVTWLLQNNKRDIPQFDVWYPCWQEKMRTDQVMRWLVTARNKIEKQGDLATFSMVHARVVASYFDEGPEIQVKAELFDDATVLFKKIPRDFLERQVIEHGVLQIERRWVDSELSAWELMDALSHVYGQLSILIDDAHRQLGILPTILVDTSSGAIRRFPPRKDHLGGRLPCMVMTGEVRTASFSLKTGNALSFTEQACKADAESMKTAKERYGPALPEHPSRASDSFKDLARWSFQMARHVFQIDGHHVPLFIFVQENKPISMMEGHAHDRAEKYLLMRRVAAEVRRLGADAVIAINEAWTASPDPDDPFKYPVDMPDRGELLLLCACSRAGEMFQIRAEITRTEGAPALGETAEQDGGALFMFAPVLEVWGRGI